MELVQAGVVEGTSWSHPHAVLLKVSFQKDDAAVLRLAGDMVEEAPELLT